MSSTIAPQGSLMTFGLEAFISPVRIETVTDWLNNNELRHIRRELPEILAQHVNWDLVSFLVERFRDTPEKLRVYRNGKKIPSVFYTKSPQGKKLDPSAMAHLSRQGLGVIFAQIKDASPQFHRLWREAEHWFGVPVQVGLIATFGSGRALDTHYDDYDIINIQVIGRKKWFFFGEPPQDPSRKILEGDPPDNVTGEVVLEPGDVLVVPRGHWHRCWSDEDNLQISLLLFRNTGVGFAHWIAGCCEDIAGMGRSLPLRPDAAAISAWERALKQHLVEAIGGVSLAEYLSEMNANAEVPVLLPSQNSTVSMTPDTMIRVAIRRPLPLLKASKLREGNLNVADTPGLEEVVAILNTSLQLSVDDLTKRLAGRVDSSSVENAVAALEKAGLIYLLRPPSDH